MTLPQNAPQSTCLTAKDAKGMRRTLAFSLGASRKYHQAARQGRRIGGTIRMRPLAAPRFTSDRFGVSGWVYGSRTRTRRRTILGAHTPTSPKLRHTGTFWVFLRKAQKSPA